MRRDRPHSSTTIQVVTSRNLTYIRALEVRLHLPNIQDISLPTSPLSALSSDDELHENGYLTLHQMPNLLYVRSLNHSLTARNISEGCPPLQAVMANLVSLP